MKAFAAIALLAPLLLHVGAGVGAEAQAQEAGPDILLSGSIEAEFRYFPSQSSHPGPPRQTGSFAFEPRLEVEWWDGDSMFVLAPFARVDLVDSKRTHFDVREAKWVGVFDALEVRLGVDRVFWGVTESVHLVDIINQDDQLEDTDAEDKLGQPMAALTWNSDIGTLTGYFMPYFRARQFPGAKGRPSAPIGVDEGRATFGGGTNKWHADWALRWSQVAGPFDLAATYFSGLNRDPRFQFGLDGDGAPILLPRYDLIDQVGLELQGTFGALLLKGEAIRRWSGPGVQGGNHNAFAVGFEYSFYGLGDGPSDLGMIAEFLYDDRGAAGPSPFEEDLMVGLRWSANDISSTTVLAGAIFDLDSSARFANIEASRRLGDDWKATLDMRFLLSVPATDPLKPFADDDFLQFRIARYF